MRAMFSAFAAIAAIAVAAFFILQEVGYSSSEQQASPSVRLD